MQVREIPGTAFWQTIEEVKKSEKNVFVCFFGDRQENGESWCPDCVKADPVVSAAANKKQDGELLIVTVGDRETWKDPANPFRVNEVTKLCSIPTLVNWSNGQRLVEEECYNEALVRSLFGLDEASADLIRWFGNFKTGFSQLSVNEKVEALFVLHNMSTPKMLNEISHQLIAITSKDFVGLLPSKVVNKVLSYLDVQSLVYCAGVNQKWRSIITGHTDLWTRVLKHFLCLREDLEEQVTSYQFYMRFIRRVHAIKKRSGELNTVSIAEVSCNPDLPSIKNMRPTPNGKLVMSYSIKQPQDFFQKYDICNGRSSLNILATLNTDYVVDFITTDKFLYSSSVLGDWHCKVWETGKEVFKINTRENGIGNRWFCSFASPCNKCPLLAVFDSNKIRVPCDDKSFCPIKMITSFVHEQHGLQFGVRCGKFICSAEASHNALVNSTVVGCDNRDSSSSLTPCDYHKVILQQQDFQIFIYIVNTQPTLSSNHDLDPELLHHLKPNVCPDVPLFVSDCYKSCLSYNQKLIGFACGSEFIYWQLDTNTCRQITISEDYSNLMLLGIGNMFTLLAEVKTLISIQPILIMTSSGKILKVFPPLEPSDTNPNGQSRLYNFFTAPLHLPWLSSDGLMNDDDVIKDDVMTVFAAAYNKGTLFSTWGLVL